jgi:hypothetical protein
MSTILVSLHGRDAGLDKDRYLTSRVGLKVPELWVGTSDAEVPMTPTVTASSTSTTIPRFGTATLPATGGANLTYHLQAPLAGSRKVILASGTSTGQILSSTAAGANFESTGGSTHVSCTIGKGGALVLEGKSTSSWHVVGNFGGVFA